MVGNYPDVPDSRIAYDDDGTVMVQLDATAGTVQFTLTEAQRRILNDESSTAHNFSWSDDQDRWLVMLFPEQRTISAYWTFREIGSPGPIQYTTDSTNGVDGTWTEIHPTFQGTAVARNGGYDKTTSRTAIVSITPVICTGLRLKYRWPDNAFAPQLRAWHIYGDLAASDRLAIWHPTLDQPLGEAALDWGDVPQGDAAETRTFRVKNRSSTITASSVSVTLETLDDTPPSVPGWHDLSADGSIFSSTISIGDIGPGATSSILHVRRAPPSNAVFGLWWLRIQAQATTWTT